MVNPPHQDLPSAVFTSISHIKLRTLLSNFYGELHIHNFWGISYPEILGFSTQPHPPKPTYPDTNSITLLFAKQSLHDQECTY